MKNICVECKGTLIRMDDNLWLCPVCGATYIEKDEKNMVWVLSWKMK
ncbi:MAG: hypothetical protein N2V78_09385 [Methanophagales archaeon]|nr:hypothetical protein [Methanophagales archaeon]